MGERSRPAVLCDRCRQEFIPSSDDQFPVRNPKLPGLTRDFKSDDEDDTKADIACTNSRKTPSNPEEMRDATPPIYPPEYRKTLEEIEEALGRYPPQPKKEPTPEEREELIQNQKMTYSKIVVDYYNANNQGAELELVEALSSSALLEVGLWIHVNFTAKPKDSDSSESSTKLYFAEVELYNNGRQIINTIAIIDPLDSENTIKGCRSCDHQIYHPKNGEWVAGKGKCARARAVGGLPFPVDRGFISQD